VTEVRVNGIPHQPTTSVSDGSDLTPDRLRTLLQDSHVNFLIGAGTPSAFFARLGNIEEALTELSEANASADVKTIIRASIQAYFFQNVLVPNLRVMRRDASAQPVLTSYALFLRTLNRILLKRHSSLLAKQANIFTTNVDMVFEVALEILGMDYSDGFSGKIRPRRRSDLDVARRDPLKLTTGQSDADRVQVRSP
jgi:hypothetical protein